MYFVKCKLDNLWKYWKLLIETLPLSKKAVKESRLALDGVSQWQLVVLEIEVTPSIYTHKENKILYHILVLTIPIYIYYI